MEELDIDFRVPGLSHAVVKEAEHFRDEELVRKIESHPHRAALQAVLQNNVYNPFSRDSKEMIRELGSVESFELCETTPKVQCSQCLLYWNQGMIYCTCGQCLIDSEFRRKFEHTKTGCTLYPGLRDQERFYPWCSTWQNRRTERVPKKPGMRGRDAAIKLTLKVDIFTGIHDRFLRDPVYCESQLAIGWTERKCKEMKKSSKNGPMRLRSYCRNQLKSLFLQNNTRDRIPLQAHRGGTSLNGIGSELIGFFLVIFFLLQLDSFTVDGDPL